MVGDRRLSILRRQNRVELKDEDINKNKLDEILNCDCLIIDEISEQEVIGLQD